MKRPFALLGISAFLTLTAAALWGGAAAAVLALVFAGLAGCVFFVRFVLRKRLSGKRAPKAFLLSLLSVFLSASFFFSLYAFAWEREFGPAQELDGREVFVTGVVLDTPAALYHRYYYLIRVQRLMEDGKPLALPEFTLRVSSEKRLDCEPYDTLVCTVRCGAFEGDGLYSTRNTRFADGAAMGGYLPKPDSVKVARGTAVSPGELAVRLRELIAGNLRDVLPEREAGLTQAMLLGKRDAISDGDAWNFRKVGASHLLVISGLHMTIVAAALCAPFRLFVRNARLRGLLSAGAVLGFLGLTGFPPSAQRSGVMCLVALLGAAVGKPTDRYNSLGFAVLVVCLLNPFSGGDVGFTLSALSTLGILCGADRLSRLFLKPASGRPFLRDILAPVANSLSVTLSALLFTLPLQATVFGGVSLFSPLANLVLILPCTLLLYLAIPTAFLGLIPCFGRLTRPLLVMVRLLAGISLNLAEDLSSLSGGYLDLSRPAGVAVLCLLVCFLTAAAWAWKFGRVRGLALFLTASAVLCVYRSSGRAAAGKNTITFALAEDSSCVLLLQGDNAAVLALGGYRTGAARELLSKNNVKKVSLLCFASRDRETREAAQAVASAYPIERVALPAGQRLPKELKQTGEPLFLEDGAALDILNGVRLETEQDLGVLTVSFGNAKVMVETESGWAGKGSCHLLVTAKRGTRVNSPFTILQNSDIIKGPIWFDWTASHYLTPSGNGLYAVLSNDGTLEFGGDSAWLGMNPT